MAHKILKLGKIYLIVFIGVAFASCEIVENVDDSLSTEEVVEGLKTALMVGTDTSVVKTSKTDGYYKDEVIKILLPEEAQTIYDLKDNALVEALSINDFIDNMEVSLNRAAEDAASEAKPIFKESITNLSISDGWEILNGKNPAGKKDASVDFDSTAATNYLKSTTYNALNNSFSPKIDVSLDKKLVSVLGNDYSTNEIWEEIVNPYNDLANTTLGQIAGIETVEVDLSDYVTKKALDGLFIKVGEEEIKIRRDPWAWASTLVGDIFERVFGSDS